MQILKDENHFSGMTLLVTLWSKAEKRLHSLFGGLNSWLVEEEDVMEGSNDRAR